jgi:hypothetical protein
MLEAKIGQLNHTGSRGPAPSVSLTGTSSDNEYHGYMPVSPDAHDDAHFGEESRSLTDEAQPPHIGETSCSTFCRRLRQGLKGDKSPPPPHQFHYNSYKLCPPTDARDQLPRRPYAHFLVKAMLGFMYALLDPFAAYCCVLISYQWA